MNRIYCLQTFASYCKSSLDARRGPRCCCVRVPRASRVAHQLVRGPDHEFFALPCAALCAVRCFHARTRCLVTRTRLMHVTRAEAAAPVRVEQQVNEGDVLDHAVADGGDASDDADASNATDVADVVAIVAERSERSTKKHKYDEDTVRSVFIMAAANNTWSARPGARGIKGLMAVRLLRSLRAHCLVRILSCLALSACLRAG